MNSHSNQSLQLALGDNFQTMQEKLTLGGFHPKLAELIFQKAYRKPIFKGWSDPRFSPKLVSVLEESNWNRPTILRNQQALDGTTKFLFGLEDGRSIESVLIPFYRKDTLCLSSQVGCAMGCRFCHTGTQGFTRNLKPNEIVGQYLKAWEWAYEHRAQGTKPPDIVFMGQGEPLHNFNSLKEAISLMCDSRGLFLSPRRITVSTAGYLPGLERFMELGGVNLAFSLHSAIPEKRQELVPIARQWSLDKVLKAIDQIKLGRRQLIVYEYMLAKGFNDQLEDANAVAKLLSNRPHMLNIIPFNPYPGSPWIRPEPQDVERFKNYLVDLKIRTTVRTTKGDEVMAACGQLKT